MTHTLMTTRTYDFDSEIEQLRSRVNTDLDINLMNTRKFEKTVSSLRNEIIRIDQTAKKNKKKVVISSSVSFFIGLLVIPVIALTLV